MYMNMYYVFNFNSFQLCLRRSLCSLLAILLIFLTELRIIVFKELLNDAKVGDFRGIFIEELEDCLSQF